MTDDSRPIDMHKVLVNPVYTGVAPFQRLVDDDTWIAAGVRQISEMGADKYLRLMLLTLRESMEWAHGGTQTRP
jgi:hypothetical protein